METIAVYWESTIRIYGITIQPGLTLFKLVCPIGSGTQLSHQLKALQQEVERFYLVTAQQIDGDLQQFSFLVDQERTGTVCRILDNGISGENSFAPMTIENVALVYLHGPHFQDRYGIADAALSLLEKNDFSILASGCTGTSVHLVVKESKAQAVVQCLGQTFVVPPPDQT